MPSDEILQLFESDQARRTCPGCSTYLFGDHPDCPPEPHFHATPIPPLLGGPYEHEVRLCANCGEMLFEEDDTLRAVSFEEELDVIFFFSQIRDVQAMLRCRRGMPW